MFIDKAFFNLRNNIILLGLLYVIFSVILIFQGSAVLLSVFVINDYDTIDEYTDRIIYSEEELKYNSEALGTIGATLLLIGITILIENMFLLCGVFLKRVSYITFWVVLRIALLCIFIGTLTLAVFIGIVDFYEYFAKMILFYFFCIGFAIFEIATVNVYRKQLSYENEQTNKICNVHIIKV